MSAFTGKQGKGAMKARREQKRREAEQRNAFTLFTRTRQYRRDVDALVTAVTA